MSYIGKQPTIGNFQVCDAISTVNGQAAYTMQVSSVNVVPETANHMIVSLNGVIQAPGSSYTVSGSTITFASNLVTGDVINFIHILGSVLDLGVPSDSTVSLAKLTATGTKDATTFLRGDNTFAVPSGGKIGQVVSTTLSTVTSTTSDTFSDISGLAVSITPSATSSKVLVFVNLSLGSQATYSAQLRLMRDSTAICIGTDSGIGGSQPQATFHQKGWSDTAIVNQGMNFLDSPSSTSSISYNVEWRETENTTLYLNRMYTTSNSVSYPWVASTITAMEVLT